jgi:hypothetical protein
MVECITNHQYPFQTPDPVDPDLNVGKEKGQLINGRKHCRDAQMKKTSFP